MPKTKTKKYPPVKFGDPVLWANMFGRVVNDVPCPVVRFYRMAAASRMDILFSDREEFQKAYNKFFEKRRTSSCFTNHHLDKARVKDFMKDED